MDAKVTYTHQELLTAVRGAYETGQEVQRYFNAVDSNSTALSDSSLARIQDLKRTVPDDLAKRVDEDVAKIGNGDYY